MQITTYADPTAFLDQTEAYLERDEAATALIIGNTRRLAKEGWDLAPYLAVAASPAGIELVAMMTPPHRLVLWSADQPSIEALDLLAGDLHDHGWNLSGVLGPPSIAEPWLECWRARSGRGWNLTMRERIYQLTSVIPPPATPGGLRSAQAADLDLLTDWVIAFEREAIGSDNDPAKVRAMVQGKIADQSFYLWDDGQPVAMVAYGRETRRTSTISLVYTPPDFRRRGYAMAAVAILSQQRLDSGKELCALYTDLANSTSNSIYQQIGYRPVCDVNAYNLADPAPDS